MNDEMQQLAQKANQLINANRLPEAREACEQLSRIEKDNPGVWQTLGLINQQLGELKDAASCFARLTQLAPETADAHFFLAKALQALNEVDGAIASYRKALELDPERIEAWGDLGILYGQTNSLAEAENAFRNVIKRDERNPIAYYSLGLALQGQGQHAEAKDCYEQALRIKPDYAEALNNLGVLLFKEGRLKEVEDCCRKAIKINPSFSLAFCNLGNALSSQGRINESIQAYQEAVKHAPADMESYSYLLMTMHYATDQTPDIFYKAHKAWGDRFRAASDCKQEFAANRDLNRRLRVGYVSPDFRAHSVAYFFEPLLQHRDKEAFETFCYSATSRPDATTARLQGLADHWVDLTTMDDHQAASRIAADGIDLLVDLSGHTRGNRLGVFLKKPAPIQITYLGYPNTTGLPTMDYRVTDEIADPAGAEQFYTEELLRLPGCFLCYRPPVEAPEVGPLPALVNGHVTFGSFNNLAKINPAVLEIWLQILRSTPHSRLLIKNPSFTDPECRQRHMAFFLANDIDVDRVELFGTTPDTAAHLAQYNRVDIALDTFPYNGTTTTCDALWMGVPVITKTGTCHVERVGHDLLTCVGLQDLVAASPQEYLENCLGLAEDLDRLGLLRSTMRERMRASRLLDGQGFVRNLEKGFRECWQKWCRE